MPIIAGRASAAYGAGFSRVVGTPYAGPYGAFDSLATINLSSTTASVTFAGIPSGYKHLQIRTLMNTTANSTQDVYMIFNGDTGANYTNHALYADGSSVAGYGYYSNVSIAKMGVNAGAKGTGLHFASAITDIVDYSNNDRYKISKILCGFDSNSGTTNINNETVSVSSNIWRDTAPITSILIYPSGGSFATNSKFALYGVR